MPSTKGINEGKRNFCVTCVPYLACKQRKGKAVVEERIRVNFDNERTLAIYAQLHPSSYLRNCGIFYAPV